MFGTIIAVGLLLLFNAVCLFIYLPPMLTEGMYLYISIILTFSLAIFGIGHILSSILSKKKQNPIYNDSLSLMRIMIEKRSLITIGIATIALIFLKMIAPLLNNTLIYGLIYCLLFILLGVSLSKTYHVGFIPILFSFSTVILSSLAAFMAFVYDHSAISQFGPERFLFALRDFVGDTTIFLLAAAFSWSAWRIAVFIRANPRVAA